MNRKERYIEHTYPEHYKQNTDDDFQNDYFDVDAFE